MPHLPSFSALALVLCSAMVLGAAEAPPLRVFSVPPGTVERTCLRLAQGDQDLQPCYQRLLADADRLLRYVPESVIDKERLPDSGDKHDYMSQAPYFWPDPAKPDGLPYIRKDGHRNPEAGQDGHSDARRLGRMTGAMKRLALAYRLSGKAAYAVQAARLLTTWFLNEQTRMRPNLEFAQAVPGVNSGRGTGMIESRHLTAAIDAVGLLAGAPAWSTEDQSGLESWFRSFLEWSRTSANGMAEAAATNNHGSFYDAQVACFALFVHQDDLARSILQGVPTRRLAVQIKPDGSQPLELARADSFSYSLFNLTALVELAILGDHLGLDLWHEPAPPGAGIKQAADFLLPYVEQPNSPWPYEHGTKVAERHLGPTLWPLAVVYGDQRYQALLGTETAGEDPQERLLWLPRLRPDGKR